MSHHNFQRWGNEAAQTKERAPQFKSGTTPCPDPRAKSEGFLLLVVRQHRKIERGPSKPSDQVLISG